MLLALGSAFRAALAILMPLTFRPLGGLDGGAGVPGGHAAGAGDVGGDGDDGRRVLSHNQRVIGLRDPRLGIDEQTQGSVHLKREVEGLGVVGGPSW